MAILLEVMIGLGPGVPWHVALGRQTELLSRDWMKVLKEDPTSESDETVVE